MCKCSVTDATRYPFEDEEEGQVKSASSSSSKEGLEMVTMPSRFEKVQDKGTIDVWWIYDEGGKTSIHTLP